MGTVIAEGGVRFGHGVVAVMRMHVAGSGVRHMLVCERHGDLRQNRRARHIDGTGNRMEREHAHQEPDQQCREQTVHRSNQYSTAVAARKLGESLLELA